MKNEIIKILLDNGNTLLIKITPTMKTIIENLKEKNWFISFSNKTCNLYNLKKYFNDIEKKNIEYTFIFDSNIFIYIINSLNENNTSNHRNAIGLIAFCQLLDIKIEIALAIYERIKSINDLPAACKEIETFSNIDNSDIDELQAYAIGDKNNFVLKHINSDDKQQKIIDWYKNFNKISKWDSFYLIILKITYIFFIEKDINQNGFFKLIDWMQNIFQYSIVCIVYAIILFSHDKLKRMMKYKSSHTKEKKIQDLRNMTWDLFIMDYYFKRCINKPDNKEFLLISADSVLKKLLRVTIKIYFTGTYSTLKEYLNIKDHCMVDYIEKNYKPNDKSRARISKSKVFYTNNYRQEMIRELETILIY